MLRLLSYNIHGCVCRDGQYRPDAVLEVIRQSNADIVALQEVIDERRERIPFIEALRALGYESVVHARTIDKPSGPYGIAMCYHDALQVLMGDLNEWRPGTRLMRSLRQHFQWVSTQPTFPSRRPFLALDRIAIRGKPSHVHFRRIDTPAAVRASDHRALLAEVAL